MPKPPPAAGPPRRALLYACWIASGAAGLILEVVWSKYLSLLLGNSIHGVSTVVAAFLGGLGIGAVLGGRLSARTRDPLLAYAKLEALIGAAGAASPIAFIAARPLFAWISGTLGGEGGLSWTVRFLVLFAGLLAPTIAMGATLPLLSSEFDRRGALFASSVGRLYALNTFGAVGGVLAAGFVLVPVLGLWKTAIVAALLDFSVAAAILMLRPGSSPGRAADAAGESARTSRVTARVQAAVPRPSDLPPPRFASLIVPLFALSGFTAILYEIAWTRILTVPFGGMVYAFTTILALYLLGIAAGSAAAARLLRSWRAPVLLFGCLEIALAATVACGSHVFPAIPRLQSSLVAAAHGSVIRFFAGEAMIAALVVAAPTFLLGALFPTAAAIRRGGIGAAGASVGAIYAANTVGAITGSLVTGFVLIPRVGSAAAILLGAAVNLAIGCTAIALGEGGARARRLAALAAAAGGCAFGLLARPEWDARRMNLGLTRLLRAHRLGGDALARELLSSGGEGGSESIRFYREGRLATVAVLETEKRKILVINGKPDATTGSGGDMMTQVMVGHLPMLLFKGAPGSPPNTAPKDVFIVGYGSGVTTHAVLAHPVREALTVELEEAVIDAAPHFREAALDPLADPRSELVIDDAGSHLRSTARLFDVIVSEPTNPWIAGVGDLFTREFYDAAASRLAPGGVFCQWVQVYEISPRSLATIFRTLASRFPSGHVFYAGPSNDLIVVASNERTFHLDPARLRSVFSRTEVARDLARVGIGSVADLLRFYRGRLESVAREAGEGPINTDDNGWLEHRAPLDLLAPDLPAFPVPPPDESAIELAAAFGPDGEGAASLLAESMEAAVASADTAAAARFRAAFERLGGSEAAALKPKVAELERRSRDAERANQILKESLPLLASATRQVDRAASERVAAMLEEAARLDPANGDIAARLGTALITAWRPGEAVPVLTGALGKLPEPSHGKVRRDLAVAYFFLRRFDDCLRELGELDRLQSGTADAHFWRARVFQERGEQARARAEIERGLRAHPADQRLRSLLEGGGP